MRVQCDYCAAPSRARSCVVYFNTVQHFLGARGIIGKTHIGANAGARAGPNEHTNQRARARTKPGMVVVGRPVEPTTTTTGRVHK